MTESEATVTIGANKGLYELAGKGEICAYYDNVMRDFISSGRVQYFPMCEYRGDCKVALLVSNKCHTIEADKIVDGLARRPAEPVFADNKITLQAVRTCQQVFSAAFTAHVETAEQDEARKNLLCTPVPHPDTDTDYLRNMLADLVNGLTWLESEPLTAWMKASRLDGFSYSASNTPESDEAYLQSLQQYGPMAAEKLMGYLAET